MSTWVPTLALVTAIFLYKNVHAVIIVIPVLEHVGTNVGVDDSNIFVQECTCSNSAYRYMYTCIYIYIYIYIYIS
jgi:hypothetical protein